MCNDDKFNALKVPKSDLNIFTKIDIEVVSFDYAPKLGENIFQAYILGDVPIMLKSKTITKEEFGKLIS